MLEHRCTSRYTPNPWRSQAGVAVVVVMGTEDADVDVAEGAAVVVADQATGVEEDLADHGGRIHSTDHISNRACGRIRGRICSKRGKLEPHD